MPHSRRKHIVAALVLLHLVSVLVCSLPGVRGNLSPSMMREPVVQHELRQWTRAFGRVGVSMTTDELQRGLFAVGTLYSDVRDVLIAPFRPYTRYFGTAQTWNLFTSAHRLPSRLEIDVEEKGAFRTVYRARDGELAWNRDKFDDTRLRKAVYLLSWKRAARTYGTFTQWIAREAARDFPGASRVRVRYWSYETPSPEQVRAGDEPEGRYQHTRVLDLEALR